MPIRQFYVEASLEIQLILPYHNYLFHIWGKVSSMSPMVVVSSDFCFARGVHLSACNADILENLHNVVT